MKLPCFTYLIASSLSLRPNIKNSRNPMVKRKAHAETSATDRCNFFNDEFSTNLYEKKKPRFKELGEKYPEFGKLLTKIGEGGAPSIDWKNPLSLKELTRVLLLDDFNVIWDMPLNRLCPPIPNRIDYLCWLNNLLKMNSSDFEANTDKNISTLKTVTVIDIGTGSSCIYPLLGTRMFKWKFIASEIDEESADWARKNVSTNQLNESIEVRHVSNSCSGGPLASAYRDSDGCIDIVMSNPPFFAVDDEVCSNPHRATGKMISRNELICEGGEIKFINDIIDDSLTLRDRILWYTSLVGRLSSVRQILRTLRSKGITNVRTTEFVQGKLKRWAIAWSYSSRGLTKEGKVPNDPSLKVLAKKKVRMKAQRAAASSAFQFEFAFFNSLNPATTFSVTKFGKGQQSKLYIPSNVPSSLMQLVERFEELPADLIPLKFIHFSRQQKCSEIIDSSGTIILSCCICDANNDTKSNIEHVEKIAEHVPFQHTFDVAASVHPAETNSMCRVRLELKDQDQRTHFIHFCDKVASEVLRQNRHWRRVEKRRAESNGAAEGKHLQIHE